MAERSMPIKHSRGTMMIQPKTAIPPESIQAGAVPAWTQAGPGRGSPWHRHRRRRDGPTPGTAKGHGTSIMMMMMMMMI
jgi:hypothetical protein